MSSVLLLASGSPRRRELLADAGFEFEIVKPAVAESESKALSMRELTMLNAARKARAVITMRNDALVLAADTLVSLNGESIGKPRDLEHAARILRKLSAREHQVCTSVVVRSAAVPHRTNSFGVISHVRVRALSEEQIRAYLAKIDPLDKAGAYAAQGHGAEIIERIRGSYSNVVGLPMDETIRALAAFGIHPHRSPYFGTVRQQTSSLLPSGSSQKNA